MFFLLLLHTVAVVVVVADVVLDKKTMKVTLTSAQLSALVYEIDPPSDGYDMLKSFNDGMKSFFFVCCRDGIFDRDGDSQHQENKVLCVTAN